MIFITIMCPTHRIVAVDHGNANNDNNHILAYGKAGSETDAGTAMKQAHGADAAVNPDKKLQAKAQAHAKAEAKAKAKAKAKATAEKKKAEAPKVAKAKLAAEKKAAKAEVQAKATVEKTARLNATSETRLAPAATAADGPAAEES